MMEIQKDESDLREYINVLIKRKWLIISTFIIAVLAAGIVSYFLLDPVYEASATIILNEPKDESDLIPYYSVEEYINMIKDGEIEEEIIEILNLVKSPYNLLANDLERKVAASYIEGTNIMEISFRFKEPELAKNIINQWAYLFVEKHNKICFDEINRMYQSLKNQFEESKKDLFDLEKEKVLFENNIYILESDYNRKVEQLNNFNDRLIEFALSLNKQEANRELLSKELESQEKTIKLKRVIDDDQYFQGLFSKITEESMETVDLKYEIEEKNPIYYYLYKELLTINSSIKMLEVEKEQIIPHINNLTKEIGTLNEELINRKLKDAYLNREYDATLEDYGYLYGKYIEIDEVYQSKSDLLEIKRMAYEPQTPIKPNKKLNLAIAGVLGLFIGIFIAFFVEFWQKEK